MDNSIGIYFQINWNMYYQCQLLLPNDQSIFHASELRCVIVMPLKRLVFCLELKKSLATFIFMRINSETNTLFCRLSTPDFRISWLFVNFKFYLKKSSISNNLTIFLFNSPFFGNNKCKNTHFFAQQNQCYFTIFNFISVQKVRRKKKHKTKLALFQSPKCDVLI